MDGWGSGRANPAGRTVCLAHRAAERSTKDKRVHMTTECANQKFGQPQNLFYPFFSANRRKLRDGKAHGTKVCFYDF